jgi:hypothetical protein
LGDSFAVLWFYQTVAFFLLFFNHACDAEAEHSTVFGAGEKVVFIMRGGHADKGVGMGVHL